MVFVPPPPPNSPPMGANKALNIFLKYLRVGFLGLGSVLVLIQIPFDGELTVTKSLD